MKRLAEPGMRAAAPWLALLLLLVLAAPVMAGEDADAKDPAEVAVTPGGWSDDVIDLMSHLPVQDQGRIKPFSTWADFFLLRISGKRTYETEDGTRMSATAWALDCLFFPAQAAEYAVVIVQDRDALVDIGLGNVAGRKRDRYSFKELVPGWERLQQKAEAYRAIDGKERSRVETQVVNLARNVRDLGGLLQGFRFARSPVEAAALLDGPAPDTGTPATVPFSAALARWPAAVKQWLAIIQSMERDSQPTEEAKVLGRFLGEMEGHPAESRILALLPPVDMEREAWLSVADLTDSRRFWQVKQPDLRIAPEHVEVVRRIEALDAARHDPSAFVQELDGLVALSKSLAGKRGEYEKIETEVHLYRVDPFFKAMWLFVVAFTLLAITWAKDLRWLRWTAIGLTVIAEILVVYGVTLRCIIRERPPVSTLYETILFITGVAVAMCLVLELINRRRIALIAAPLLGFMGLALAAKYEVLKGEDTMPQLQAVLDTNYWLTLHVLTVTWGYCTGLVASLLAHFYVLGKAFGIGKDEKTYRALAKVVYGMVAFTLLLSTVGTILGGVWANESWGRFWGWDPKENGALMIVLWNIIILHARLGGFVKSFGMSMAAIFGGLVVAASWWGVNLLGIGLHTYGFTEGIAKGLLWFAVVEIAVLATGAFWYFNSRSSAGRTASPPAAP